MLSQKTAIFFSFVLVKKIIIMLIQFILLANSKTHETVYKCKTSRYRPTAVMEIPSTSVAELLLLMQR